MVLQYLTQSAVRGLGPCATRARVGGEFGKLAIPQVKPQF